MSNTKKIAVIGGGAAGMLAAGHAALYGADVSLFEQNQILGKKILITGKGRCNVTNDCDSTEFIKNLTKNPRFLYSAINAFSTQDTKNFFENLGVPLKVERGNRVFPVSDRAADISDALQRFIKDCGVCVIHERVLAIEQNSGKITEIKTLYATYSDFDAVILATGGASYPRTGSDGFGFKLAQRLGHTVNPLIPSLVPLKVKSSFCAKCQGLSLKNVAVSVVDNDTQKSIYSDFGELLFTHFGLSGPTILSASAHMRPMRSGKYTVKIDLKPALDEKALDLRLQRDFAEQSNKNFSNVFGKLLPQKLIEPFIAETGISPDKKVNSITKEERKKIVFLMKNLAFSVSDFLSLDQAVVTSGGIDIKEIEPKTMRSKIIENLYFCGEIIDVDAYTGGFNLQIAFSTAYSAAKAASESE